MSEQFSFGGFSGTTEEVIQAYKRRQGSDEVTPGELSRWEDYRNQLPKEDYRVLAGRLRGLLENLPRRTSRFGGAESGVQLEYGLLVSELQARIESGQCGLEDIQRVLRDSWQTVKHSFRA